MPKGKKGDLPAVEKPCAEDSDQIMTEGGPVALADVEAGMTIEGGEPSAVVEPKPGEMDEALGNLGDAVAREQSRYDLSEGAHQSAVGRMEQLGDDLELDVGSLVPGVRDFLLDIIKSRPKPWGATSTGEQRDVAAACEQLAEGMIRQVVELIRSDGKKPVRVLLEKVTLGGDAIQISGKVKTFGSDEEDEAVMLLHHARGKHVMLTPASVDDYKGDSRPAAVDEEEPALPFEAGGHPEDDSDLVDAAEAEPGTEVLVVLPHDGVKSGMLVNDEKHGEVGIHIDLKTGMVTGLTDGDEYVDLREATPGELAAERERIADFGDEGQTTGAEGQPVEA